MSNEVILEIVKTIGIVLTALFSLIGVIYSVKASKNAEKASTHAASLDTKVDEYHKEVNGKMGLLIETTKQLATAKEKAKQEKE